MSTDAYDLQNELYQLADAAGDGQVTTAQVEALLARMQGAQPAAQQPGIQHQAAGDPFGPGGHSTLVGGEAVPAAPAQPVSIGQLPKLVDDAIRRAAPLGEQDQRDALWTLAESMNASLDEHARQQAGQVLLDPLAGQTRPPATSDQELRDLEGRINAAAVDPGGHDALALADELNATIGELGRQHERQVDDFEARRDAAERQRHAKARTQDSAAKELRRLAGQLDGAAGAGR